MKTFIFGVVFGISIDNNNENNILLSQNNEFNKTIDGGQNWTPTGSELEVLEKDVDYIDHITKILLTKTNFFCLQLSEFFFPMMLG